MLKLTKEKLIKNYLLPNSQTIDLRLIKEPFELDENLILDYNLLISNNSFRIFSKSSFFISTVSFSLPSKVLSTLISLISEVSDLKVYLRFSE